MAENEKGLASTRDRRSNAGARMSRLLDAEDDDDFYKTTYGGFTEEVDDNDYQTEDSATDETDSDIDLDENEEVASDVEVEGDERRKRRVITKAYKEPKKQCVVTKSSTSVTRTEKPKSETAVPLEPAIRNRSSLRKSTCEKTRSTEDFAREREARMAIVRQIADRKHVTDVRRLTQEELLAEAKITEKINLRSLETFQKLELEKKKSRVHRQTYSGPIIRYHSVTVPVVDELSTVDAEINVDSDTVDSSDPVRSRSSYATAEKCSRTFITFSDEVVYRRYFPSRRKLRSADKSTCPITGLPAKYFDPVTRIPYASAEAFKVIRQSFQNDADFDQSKQTIVS